MRHCTLVCDVLTESVVLPVKLPGAQVCSEYDDVYTFCYASKCNVFVCFDVCGLFAFIGCSLSLGCVLRIL